MSAAKQTPKSADSAVRHSLRDKYLRKYARLAQMRAAKARNPSPFNGKAERNRAQGRCNCGRLLPLSPQTGMLACTCEPCRKKNRKGFWKAKEREFADKKCWF
jgi:hypothetical protein